MSVVICTSEKLALEDKTCDTNSTSCHKERKSTGPETSGETEIAHLTAPTCTTISVVQSTANNENLKENRDMTESGIINKSAHQKEANFERDDRGADDKAIMTRSLVPVNSSGSCTDGPSRSSNEQIEDQIPEQFASGSEASDSESLQNSVEQEIQIDNADQDVAVSDYVKLVEEACPSAGSLEVMRETLSLEHSQIGDETISEHNKKELDDDTSSAIVSRRAAKSGGKRRRELDFLTNDGCNIVGFVESPCEGLRPRARKNVPESRADTKKPLEEKPTGKKVKRSLQSSNKDKKEQRKGTHRCDIEGCRMSFQTKVELQLHKRNRCPIEGCGKKFTSHKYALVHQRVHQNDRPLKCPWKGCTMTFKWAWARTEHLRVHTGERPYKCKVEGCGLTFRFVSDYSRHRRKTGHYVDAAN